MESAPITNGESSKRPRSASPVAGSPPSKKTTLSTDTASSENTKPEASEASSGPPVAAQVEDEESALNVNAASAGSKWNTKVNRKNDLPKGKRGKEWKGNKDKSDRDQSWHKGADQRKPKADGEAEEDGEGGKRLPKKKAAILIGYCGTGYNGMQIQNQENTKTIEGDIFAALVKAGAVSEANSEDHRKVDVQRAARTDAGVHAAGNCISMKMIVAPPLPAEHPTLASYVNSFLPEQIRMWGFVRTLKSFAARTGCDSRKYEYLLPSYCLLPPASSDYLSQALDKSSPGWRETLGPAADFADAGVPLDAEDAAEQSENARLNPKSRGEFERRRGWRCDQQTLERFRTLVAEFKGTHNFHNYTVGKPFNDRTVRRFMMSLEVQDPVVVGEIEWISVKIHGQSFMLHQIRKMMSLAMLACRTGSPPALIKETFGPKRIHVPKAPPLGLLLEAPQFGAYNRRITEGSNGIQGGGRDLVDWDLYRKEIDEFKFKWIYDRLRQDELETNVFHKFIRQMDCTATDLLCFLNTQGIIPPEAEVSTQQPQKKKEAKEANTEGVKADSKDGEKKAALGLDSDDEEVDQEMLKRGELEG